MSLHAIAKLELSLEENKDSPFYDLLSEYCRLSREAFYLQGKGNYRGVLSLLEKINKIKEEINEISDNNEC